MMLRLRDGTDFTELQGDQYDYCTICGPEKFRAVIHFDSGSVEPTVDETVTGATSGDTGVVEFVQLISGTYAGGDAVGVMVVDTPTGYNSDNLTIFSDDENLNGSTAGNNFATVKGTCGINKNGRIYRTQDLVEYRGERFCKEHFAWRFRHEWADEQDIDIRETERGKV